MDLPRASSIAPVPATGQERVAVEGPVEQDQHSRAAAGAAVAGPRLASSRSMPIPPWRRAGRGCRSRPAPSASASGTRPSPSDSGSCRSSDGCGQCRGSSPSCSRRTRRSAALRIARRAYAAGPAARPPPRTGPSAVPGPGGGASHAAPSPTGAASAMPASPAVSLPQTLHVAQPGEHPEREHEVHPGSRGQATQSAAAPSRSAPGHHRPARTAGTGLTPPDGPGRRRPRRQ